MKIDLHLGDCLTVLKTIPSDSVDCVITSPPYNLGNNHHTGNIRHHPYNDSIPEEEYQANQILVLNELYRIVKTSGSLFYNHKNRIRDGLSIVPYQWILKSKWMVKQELVWFNRSQNFDKIRFYPMTERIYWLVRSPLTKITNTINHHDLFNWGAEGTKGKHTRAFPEEMVSDFLKCLPESRVVLDPYMGSGTTGVGSLRSCKDFIGIEISPEYFEIAKRRIEEVQSSIGMEP